MKNKNTIIILLLIGVMSLTVRTILDSQFAHSTLLYLAVPFLISIAIGYLTHPSTRQGYLWHYLNHLRISTIVFLASAAFLFEGFICVLVFMPIYYFFVSIGHLTVWVSNKNKHRQSPNQLHALGLPILVLVATLEGLTPLTSFPRDMAVSHSIYTPLTVTELHENLAQPFSFANERHWFVRLFPGPDEIRAGSLNQGDTHQLDFTYKRWIWSNIHRGTMDVALDKVTQNHIRTVVTHNDSYLANYLDLRGTDVHFIPHQGGGTTVSVTVRYKRILDPAWYFGPLQRFAVKQCAYLLLRDVVLRYPIETHPI